MKKQKEKYILFCQEENAIPIFSQPWWLDAVSEGGIWDVAIVERGGQIWATMPYYIRKRYGFTFITMPILTQTLGPYIKYPKGQKYYKKLSWEKELMNELIDQLPHFDYFYQQWNYSVSNWLPFYWRGFRQTTRYTYVIENMLQAHNDIVDEFSHAKRKQINKALRGGIRIIDDFSNTQNFYEMHIKELSSEGSNIQYKYETLERIFQAIKINDGGRIFAAVDEKDNLHAALLIIWNKYSAYDLISSFNPDFLDSGATSLLVYEAIKYCKSIGVQSFDFEGSMIENVENSFRQFATIQKPYFAISKTNSRTLKAYQVAKDILRW